MAAMLDIPEDKDTFKIGEVSKMLELEPYVLRYWETEFEQLAPDKTRSGQRVYTQEDIDILAHIQHLLHVEMYTIAGARRQLELGAQTAPVIAEAAAVVVDEAQAEQLEGLSAELELERGRAQALTLELEQRLVELELAQAQLKELELEVQRQEAEIEVLGQRLQTKIHDERAQRERHESIDARWELLSEQLNDNVSTLEAELERMRAQAGELELERDALAKELEPLRARQETQERLERELEQARVELSVLRERQGQQRAEHSQRHRAMLAAMRQELGRLRAPFEGVA